MSARLHFSLKYFSEVVKKAMKPLILMYLEVIGIFLRSKTVLNLVYLSVFKKYAVSDLPPSRHIPMDIPPGSLALAFRRTAR